MPEVGVPSSSRAQRATVLGVCIEPCRGSVAFSLNSIKSAQVGVAFWNCYRSAHQLKEPQSGRTIMPMPSDTHSMVPEPRPHDATPAVAFGGRSKAACMSVPCRSNLTPLVEVRRMAFRQAMASACGRCLSTTSKRSSGAGACRVLRSLVGRRSSAVLVRSSQRGGFRRTP